MVILGKFMLIELGDVIRRFFCRRDGVLAFVSFTRGYGDYDFG